MYNAFFYDFSTEIYAYMFVMTYELVQDTCLVPNTKCHRSSRLSPRWGRADLASIALSFYPLLSECPAK